MMERFIFEVHEYNDIIYGYEINWLTWAQAKAGFDCHFEIQGRTRGYLVVTNNRYITRQEALTFATTHFKGLHITKTVDLSTVSMEK